MKTVSLALTLLAAVAGLRAAYLWLVASRVDFRAFEEVNGDFREASSTDLHSWIEATKLTLQKSGKLNGNAATWTAISVALAAMSAILGAFAQST